MPGVTNLVHFLLFAPHIYKHIVLEKGKNRRKLIKFLRIHDKGGWKKNSQIRIIVR
jgi:hypothetical protein